MSDNVEQRFETDIHTYIYEKFTKSIKLHYMTVTEVALALVL